MGLSLPARSSDRGNCNNTASVAIRCMKMSRKTKTRASALVRAHTRAHTLARTHTHIYTQHFTHSAQACIQARIISTLCERNLSFFQNSLQSGSCCPAAAIDVVNKYLHPSQRTIYAVIRHFKKRYRAQQHQIFCLRILLDVSQRP